MIMVVVPSPGLSVNSEEKVRCERFSVPQHHAAACFSKTGVVAVIFMRRLLL